MPDFLPTPQMPTALAAELLRLKSQAGDPWAALAQSLGKDTGQGAVGYAAGKRDFAAKQPLTPEQQVSMGLTAPAPGPAQPGQTSPTQSMPAFNKGMPMSLAENMLQRKTQEDIARETTSRTLDAANTRAGLAPVPVNQMHKDQYQKVYGHEIPFSELTQNQEKELAAQFAAKSKPAGGAGSGIQMDKFVQTEMDKANKAVNPLNATRGTALGNAGIMLTRIGTAKETLADPQITPQQMAAVTTDLAGIVQMGTPHELGIKDQDYSTWWTKANALAGRIKNKPEEAQSPETVKKLKDLVNGYEKVYNGLVQKNLDAHKKSVQSIAKKYPEYKSSYDALEKDIREKYPLEQAADSNFDDLYKKHGLQ